MKQGQVIVVNGTSGADFISAGTETLNLTINGGLGDDTMSGSADANSLRGGGGDVILRGGAAR